MQKKPISEEISKIIENQKDKVNESNYASDPLIDYMLGEGKNLIDDARLEETKQNIKGELEAYAKKPISDEILKIIDDAVSKITPDNYKDEAAIKDITDEAKQKINEKELEKVKQDIEDKLLDYAKKPINDEVKKIIEDAINQVTPDNYKDEVTLEEITNQAKEQINIVDTIESKKKALDELTETYQQYIKMQITLKKAWPN